MWVHFACIWTGDPVLQPCGEQVVIHNWWNKITLIIERKLKCCNNYAKRTNREEIFCLHIIYSLTGIHWKKQNLNFVGGPGKQICVSQSDVTHWTPLWPSHMHFDWLILWSDHLLSQSGWGFEHDASLNCTWFQFPYNIFDWFNKW